MSFLEDLTEGGIKPVLGSGVKRSILNLGLNLYALDIPNTLRLFLLAQKDDLLLSFSSLSCGWGAG